MAMQKNSSVFVQGFVQIYGEREASHNIHSLIHLADDVKVHGPLDSFSAFPFESNMKFLKKVASEGRPPT